nr:paraquat-inducible protein A [uncultured Tateyamaria sp.]
MTQLNVSSLLVCPQCDALYRAKTPVSGEVSVCQRCHHVIATPRRKAGMQIISLALASLIMIVGAVFFPFLRIEAAGLSNAASVLDVALSFGSGLLSALIVMTAAFIVFIPALRLVLLLYVLTPVVFDTPPAAGARTAFRWAEDLTPWAMAEIFALGVAVALIKVGDLAFVNFGPAFWMFAVLVLLLILLQRSLCSWSVWHALNPSQS